MPRKRFLLLSFLLHICAFLHCGVAKVVVVNPTANLTVLAQTNFRQSIDTGNVRSTINNTIIYFISNQPKFVNYNAFTSEIYGSIGDDGENDRWFSMDVNATDGTVTRQGTLQMASYRLFVNIVNIPKNTSSISVQYSLTQRPLQSNPTKVEAGFLPFIRLFKQQQPNSTTATNLYIFTLPDYMFKDRTGRELLYSVNHALPNAKMPWFSFDPETLTISINLTFNDALLGLKDTTIAPYSQTPSGGNGNWQEFRGIIYAILPLIVEAGVIDDETQTKATALNIPIVLSFLPSTNLSDPAVNQWIYNGTQSVPLTTVNTAVNETFSYLLPFDVPPKTQVDLYPMFLGNEHLSGTVSTPPPLNESQWFEFDRRANEITGRPLASSTGIWRLYIVITRSKGVNSGFMLLPATSDDSVIIRGLGSNYLTIDVVVSETSNPQLVVYQTAMFQYSPFAGGFVNYSYTDLLATPFEYFEYQIRYNASTGQKSKLTSVVLLGNEYPWWLLNVTNTRYNMLTYFGYAERQFKSLMLYIPEIESLVSVQKMNGSSPVVNVNYSLTPLTFKTANASPLKFTIPDGVFELADNSTNPDFATNPYELKRLSGSIDAFVVSINPVTIELDPNVKDLGYDESNYTLIYNNASFVDITVVSDSEQSNLPWVIPVVIIIALLLILFIISFLVGHYLYEKTDERIPFWKYMLQLGCLYDLTRTVKRRFRMRKPPSAGKPKERPPTKSFTYSGHSSSANIWNNRNAVDVPMVEIPLHESFDFSWQSVLERRLSTTEKPVKRLSVQEAVLFAEIGKPFHFQYPLANMAEALAIPRSYTEAFDNIPIYKEVNESDQYRDLNQSAISGLIMDHDNSIVRKGPFTLDNEVWNASRYHRASYMSFDEKNEQEKNSFTQEILSAYDMSHSHHHLNHIIVVFTARLHSGGDLPSWLRFNPKRGTFYGIPSNFDRMSWEIEIVGHRIDINSPCPSDYGDSTFSSNILENKVVSSIADVFMLQII